MNESYKRLIETLSSIFQMDRADLDFGIYRIMNMKRDEMNDFLEKRLLTQVEHTLRNAGTDDSVALQKELTALENTLRTAGVEPDTNAKVLEMRTKLKSAGSPEALTNEVFSHLTAFFRRYYHKGDFISQRRYKKDVYAIPYEGEEVKLHWANHDQYYIKTGEHFRNYSFRTHDGHTISFNLRDADIEKDNNKGKNRFFRLCETDFLSEEGGELKIWFTYEPTDKKEKQPDLNSAAIEAIIPAIPADFRAGVLKIADTKANPKRTLLEKHLTEYTARNTFDYFIHKDLGGFLNRELDFYIKNELLHIDDIDLDRPDRFDRQLRIIKGLKRTALDIIALLAQLENFQKRLWLKKKFVVQSDYCITLDSIPETFYPDIASNTAQREEWIKLFAIDEIKPEPAPKQGKLLDDRPKVVAYSVPLSNDFLKANPFLVVDTKFYSREWKYRLLSTIDNLDKQTDGLLINSENFQALNFLQERYREQVKCNYADPPYNTGSGDFIYKDGFSHSSWLTYIVNTIGSASKLMSENSLAYYHIDDREMHYLKEVLQSVFGVDSFQSQIAWKNKYGPGALTKGYGSLHEHILVYTKGLPESIETNLSQEEQEKYSNKDAKFNTRGGYITQPVATKSKDDRPNLVYPLVHNGKEIWPDKQWIWAEDRLKAAYNNDEIVINESKGKYSVRFKQYLMDDKGQMRNGKPLSLMIGPYNQDGTKAVEDLFGERSFSFPKPVELVKKLLGVIINGFELLDSIFIDYFAGSGTTGHAVINLNRDGGKRKYILVEMGTYFNTVTKPRIQKVVYSKEWKEGKPVGRDGISHCFKYMRLEGYEDTLNNLRMERTATQSALLEEEHFGREYMLHYMLGHESRESLLNLTMFKRPFGHTLLITENNEATEQEVDLVETFNYLIGLVVKSVEDIRGTIVVQGALLNGDKVLVIWRDVELMDNKALDAFFRKLDINTRDTEFRRIYVNGDNNLQNLRTDDEQWKVTLIEEEFGKRMFDVKDV